MAKRVAENPGLSDSQKAKPQGKLKVPATYTTLRYPKMMDCEMVNMERKDVELKEMSHSESRE
eukprot:4965647-Pyramimonas_sp.AAC.1